MPCAHHPRDILTLGTLAPALLLVEAPEPVPQPVAFKSQQGHIPRVGDALLGLIARLFPPHGTDGPIHSYLGEPGLWGFLGPLFPICPSPGSVKLAAAAAGVTCLATS